MSDPERRPLAQVHSIYETNHRDLPGCLDRLKADVAERGASAVVTIFIGAEGLDVRGIGDCDIHKVAAYLLAAQAHIAEVLLDACRTVAEERADE